MSGPGFESEISRPNRFALNLNPPARAREAKGDEYKKKFDRGFIAQLPHKLVKHKLFRRKKGSNAEDLLRGVQA